MYLRYPVLGLSTHRDYIYRRFPFSYSPKLPFIFSFGCATSFYSWLSTRGVPLRRLAGKAGFRHFPFASFSFLVSPPDKDSTLMIRRTRRCRLFVWWQPSHRDAHGQSNGISFIAASDPERKRYVSTPRCSSPLHAGTRRDLVPVGGQVISYPRTRHDLFHLAFSATVFYRSYHHYSVAKIACRRDRFLEP